MDDESPAGKKGKVCVCDKTGCHFSGAPICLGYNGYGVDYLWTPGAVDEWTHDREFENTFVNDDFTLTYQGAEKDPRFENRVKWWEPNGPSVCRILDKILMPGLERPVMKNDDGGNSWDYWNILTCDMEIHSYPRFPNIGTYTTGLVLNCLAPNFDKHF